MNSTIYLIILFSYIWLHLKIISALAITSRSKRKWTFSLPFDLGAEKYIASWTIEILPVQ